MSSGESRTTEGRGRLYDDIMDTIGNTPGWGIYTAHPKLDPDTGEIEFYVRVLNPDGESMKVSTIRHVDEATFERERERYSLRFCCEDCTFFVGDDDDV